MGHVITSSEAAVLIRQLDSLFDGNIPMYYDGEVVRAHTHDNYAIVASKLKSGYSYSVSVEDGDLSSRISIGLCGTLTGIVARVRPLRKLEDNKFKVLNIKPLMEKYATPFSCVVEVKNISELKVFANFKNGSAVSVSTTSWGGYEVLYRRASDVGKDWKNRGFTRYDVMSEFVESIATDE